jgi:hypothetical protein
MLFRVLRTAKATLTRTLYLDEVATDATGAVGVAVAKPDGTVVQTASIPAPDADHGYTFTWQGSDDLAELDLAWSATVGGDAIVLDRDVIQVVGGFYFGLSEARGIDPKFKDTARFTTQDLVDRRIEVEDEFEAICEQAFVPRYCREVLSGTGTNVIKLRWPRLRRVLSVTVAGVGYAPATVAGFGPDMLGLLRHDGIWPRGVGNVVVEYEHGMDRPPTDIARVSKLRMKSMLLTSQSPLPDRAERIATTEMGLVTLAVATARTTGIPEVDAALDRHPSPRPGFG